VLSCKKVERFLELRRSQGERGKAKYAVPQTSVCIKEKNRFRDLSYYDQIAGGLHHD
jgi:hypothetical protein